MRKMYAACAEHADTALDEMLRQNVNRVKILRVSDRPNYSCHCEKQADFLLAEPLEDTPDPQE